MKKEDFDELLGSVREAGAYLRGEAQPSRVFKVDVPIAPNPSQPQFAICVQTDDPELLIPHKLYQVTVFPSGDIGVQDEAGEAAIYPADHFILIELPSEVEHALLEA
ncbi:MAG: hypothetical protein ACJ74W_11325 [Pyrinomonadaceae bacterium]